jgi:hypothetical protein
MQPDRTHAQRLICAECGRADPDDEQGWTLRLDVDDELAASVLSATSGTSAMPTNRFTFPLTARRSATRRTRV